MTGTKYTWVRVSPRNRCPVCSHDSWCTYAPEAGLVHCQRVESDRPSKNSMGGWLHEMDDQPPRPRSLQPKPVEPGPTPDFAQLLSSYDRTKIGTLSFDLGLSEQSLRDLGTRWSPVDCAWAFPMVNSGGQVTGVRLRGKDGSKWAIRGSKQGLFIPIPALVRISTDVVLICEGPTDTAAALDMGLFAIGRAACLGQEAMVASCLAQINPTETIIVYDNDGPGVRGADKLAEALPGRVSRFVPPGKDLRKFKRDGGSAELLSSLVNNCVRTRSQVGKRQTAPNL